MRSAFFVVGILLGNLTVTISGSRGKTIEKLVEGGGGGDRCQLVFGVMERKNLGPRGALTDDRRKWKNEVSSSSVVVCEMEPRSSDATYIHSTLSLGAVLYVLL